MLEGDRPVMKVAFKGKDYLGNILGFCPSENDIENMELKGVKHDKSSIYLYNFVIVPEEQDNGYGSALLEEFISEAKRIGYRQVEGHFRQNKSLALIRRKGAIETEAYENWANTGETYVHCILDLDNISESGYAMEDNAW